MGVADNIKKEIYKAVKIAFPELEIKLSDINLEHPTAEEHGDYSTNIAMILAKKLGKNPREGATSILKGLQGSQGDKGIREHKIWERVEIAGPGFINFWLSEGTLIGEIKEKDPPSSRLRRAKKIEIEIVSPNINKPLHIGHLRNGALGMSLAAAYEFTGWKVIKDEINNDRGLHIMKAAYGYLLFGRKKPVEEREWKILLDEWLRDSTKWFEPSSAGATDGKPDHFVGKFYVLGEKFLTENEEFANKQLSEMLLAWEAEDKGVWKLWKTMGDWVHEGIDASYRRFGINHDKKWYEHLLYKEGKGIILDGLKKGFFEKLPDGAIQANLEKYGYPNKILIRHDGTSIYMTFDIALTRQKILAFKADKYVWIVGSDQIDHFKRLFKIFEILGFGSSENFYHLAYGMVRVPGGKMSSRLGNVILADDLMDKMREMAKGLMSERKIASDTTKEEKEKIADAVGIGAIKYTMLKVNPMADVVFDLEKSVSLEGDSGPYLQYTYARARSVLRRANFQFSIYNFQSIFNDKNFQLANEEVSILRWIYRFPEVVETAAKTFSPNLICSYLFELAKRFNTFYNEVPILQGDQDNRGFRIALTEAVSIVLKNGLTILGITALEKM